MKSQLKDVTIIIVDTVNYGQAVRAIKKCQEQVDADKIVFLTDIHYPNPDGFEVKQIPTIRSKEEYSHFMIKELYKYFDTDFCLVIQHDGYILSGEAWNDEFLDYDYIGAPWVYEHNRNIGNGGFSLRSLKLQTILGEDPLITTTHHEDQAIGVLYRKYLEEKYDIRFPSEHLAETFSFELREPRCRTFGFHGHFHKPYKESVVIKRLGAMGDIVALEPVLEHFYKKGYHVYLDCPQNIFQLFFQGGYPMKHVSQLDKSRIPFKEYNLDLSYETKPKQLHLQSYFEHCGVTDYKLRNPRLFFRVDDANRLFKKYVVLHIDQRDQPGRNVFGVAWHTIVSQLTLMGYDVIQIGRGKHQLTGALEMNLPSENLLAWLIAGSSFFIGVDSGPSAIAVALGRYAIILSGSVDLKYLYYDLSNIYWINKHEGETPVCGTPFCWHEVVGEAGQDCYIDKIYPPCVQFNTQDVLDACGAVDHRLKLEYK